MGNVEGAKHPWDIETLGNANSLFENATTPLNEVALQYLLDHVEDLHQGHLLDYLDVTHHTNLAIARPLVIPNMTATTQYPYNPESSGMALILCL